MTDYKNLKLRASSNPHIRNGEDTRGLMLDVIIALMPALLFGVWHFGVRVAISAVVSVASAIFFEWLYRKLLHKPQMIGDLSAAVTGLLLSMVCPPELPVWMLVVGNFFAIFVVKQLYGGLGKNFLNPALAARAALVACYASAMTSWSKVDAATGATPMALLKAGDMEALTDEMEQVDGIPVYSLFSPDDIAGYISSSPKECPMCRAGQKIDALANSFGLSML